MLFVLVIILFVLVIMLFVLVIMLFLYICSYPALLVVPQSVSDDNIRRFSRTHRQCR